MNIGVLVVLLCLGAVWLLIDRTNFINGGKSSQVSELDEPRAGDWRMLRKGTRLMFESEMIALIGDGAATLFHVNVTAREYTLVDIYEEGSLKSVPDGEVQLEMVNDMEIVVRFAAPPLPTVRYLLVLGWRRIAAV